MLIVLFILISECGTYIIRNAKRTQISKVIGWRIGNLIFYGGVNIFWLCNADVSTDGISGSKQSVIDTTANSMGSLFVVE